MLCTGLPQLEHRLRFEQVFAVCAPDPQLLQAIVLPRFN
jgi:hypothetical protein